MLIKSLLVANGIVINDLSEVREIIYRLQRPAIAPKPKLVYAHDWEERDFVLFHRGLLHSVVARLIVYK
ncbi:hypothetical protein F4813DRAFT_131057 [Daldinia decipiens]|uniref:uncharacterized protein n=1 Tax=Daldinia decipiens TaxID=326647 RepID=UPI0020C484E4|nr:uncharacterized protein F4813DRAFT_131057 [Daldinia decipiens]KAI1656303.1 hypothetical protein F4813DRAFT_131057 [Daldinia decipiens]